MQCPNCSGKTEVTHNRSFPEYIRRRRVCKQCGAVMTTYETLKPPGERYPMGRPKQSVPKITKRKKTAPKQPALKKPEPKQYRPKGFCPYNAGVYCDGKTECSECGWKPKEGS